MTKKLEDTIIRNIDVRLSNIYDQINKLEFECNRLKKLNHEKHKELYACLNHFRYVLQNLDAEIV